MLGGLEVGVALEVGDAPGDDDVDGGRDAGQAQAAESVVERFEAAGEVDGVAVGEDDEELVAAQAEERVGDAELAAQGAGDVLDRGVAGGVADGVVELLEVVVLD